jgi:hypothetical protein
VGTSSVVVITTVLGAGRVVVGSGVWKCVIEVENTFVVVYTVSTWADVVLVTTVCAGFLAIPMPSVAPTMIAVMTEAIAKTTRDVIHLAFFVMKERLKGRDSMSLGSGDDLGRADPPARRCDEAREAWFQLWCSCYCEWFVIEIPACKIYVTICGTLHKLEGKLKMMINRIGLSNIVHVRGSCLRESCYNVLC